MQRLKRPIAASSNTTTQRLHRSSSMGGVWGQGPLCTSHTPSSQRWGASSFNPPSCQSSVPAVPVSPALCHSTCSPPVIASPPSPCPPSFCMERRMEWSLSLTQCSCTICSHLPLPSRHCGWRMGIISGSMPKPWLYSTEKSETDSDSRYAEKMRINERNSAYIAHMRRFIPALPSARRASLRQFPKVSPDDRPFPPRVAHSRAEGVVGSFDSHSCSGAGWG